MGLSFSKFLFRFFGFLLLVATLQPYYIIISVAVAVTLVAVTLVAIGCRYIIIYKLSFALFLLCSIPLPFKLSFVYRASQRLILCFVPILYFYLITYYNMNIYKSPYFIGLNNKNSKKTKLFYINIFFIRNIFLI